MSDAHPKSSPRAAASVGLLLVFVILLLVNVFSFRHYQRWDWSDEGWFTLSERTRQVLADLKEPIDIYVLLSPGERNLADLQDVLEAYRAESAQLTIEYVDPDRERLRYQALAKRFGIRSLSDEATLFSQVPVVVSSGERKWKIERGDLIAPDMASLDEGPQFDVQTERALTGALLEVTMGQDTTVCVSQGHGEWSLMAEERSLAAAVSELEWEKVKFQTFALIGEQPPPEGCAALWVIGPQRAFGQAEKAALRRYHEAGGHVLLALDPVLDRKNVAATGLEGWLHDLGVEVGADVVLEFDEAHILPPGSVDAFVVSQFSSHDITEPLRAVGGGVPVAVARSVSVVPGGGAQMLFSTTNSGYRESSVDGLLAVATGKLPDASKREAVSLAVAKEVVADAGAATPGRLVVIGDADWLDNAFLEEPGFANRELLSSLVGWLTERKALISVAPRKTDAQSVIMSDADLGAVFFRVVVLIPLAFLFAGFAMWWSRRS